MKKTLLIFFAGVLASPLIAQKAAISPDHVIEAKIEKKISNMTLDEKIGQMILLEINMMASREKKYSIPELIKMPKATLDSLISSLGLNADYNVKTMKAPTDKNDTQNFIVWYSLSQAIQAKAVFKLDTASMNLVFGKFKVGGILNAPNTRSQTPEVWHEIIKQIQEYSLTKIGIPCIYGIDQMHGTTYTTGGTFFPQAINMAATYNRKLANSMGEISAYETKAGSLPWSYSPVMDIGRNAAWARLYETFGEDAYLAGELGTQVINGLQGNDPNHIGKYNVAACLKHFFAYGIPNSGLDRTPTFIDPQNLREKQFAPFLKGFRAGALSTMTNSSTVNGMNGVANKVFLTEWLKDGVRWDGLIVTDWGDIENLRNRDHIASTKKEAIMLAVNAGVDMMMVPSDFSYGPLLKDLVKEGKVPMSRVDDAVRRILRLKYRLNLFDRPYTEVKDYPEFASAKHQAIALQSAEESEVLLKNENNVLPLIKGKKIFVCGPNANSMRCLNGGWSNTWQGDNSDAFSQGYHTILDALKRKFGAQNVNYEAGVSYKTGGAWYEEEDSGIDKAIVTASSADYIIVCVGENSYAENVGNITDVNLSSRQKDLVRAMQRTGKQVILVLNEGRPRLVYDLVEDSKAVINIMLPGNYGGDALANLLSGEANFSGKLPFTYPLQPNALTNYDYKVSDENVTLTGTFDFSYKAHASYQWQFGTGLSYTTFQYSNLKINKTRFNPDDDLEFTIDLKNTGKITGKESIILYSSDIYASLMPDNKRLRAFDKIELRPSETRTVKFKIKASDLAFVGADSKWILEEGDFAFSIGSQSATITCVQSRKWETPNIEN